MIVIKCPNCKQNLEIDISKAIDEHAEVYRCSKCNYYFRYAEK